MSPDFNFVFKDESLPFTSAPQTVLEEIIKRIK
jgi:hypothetical protein